jgi:hypothetical protein
VVAVALLALGPASARAQDATPAPAEPPHPVHIHKGSCAALGDIVYPLNDIVTYDVTKAFTFGPAATPEAGAMASPPASAGIAVTAPVLFSWTHIAAEVPDLVEGGYAVNAHESMANIGHYIACGDIPQCTVACQTVTGVVVDLAPLNRSGYFGVASIEADRAGGSDVAVFLFHPSGPASG